MYDQICITSGGLARNVHCTSTCPDLSHSQFLNLQEYQGRIQNSLMGVGGGLYLQRGFQLVNST